jgi:hypothetical protein
VNTGEGKCAGADALETIGSDATSLLLRDVRDCVDVTADTGEVELGTDLERAADPQPLAVRAAPNSTAATAGPQTQRRHKLHIVLGRRVAESIRAKPEATTGIEPV